MKIKLGREYGSWQNDLDNGIEDSDRCSDLIEIADTIRIKFEKEIQKAFIKLITEENVPKKSLVRLREELKKIKVELNEKFDNFCSQATQQVILNNEMNELLDSSEEDFDDSDDELQQGVTFQRIQQFEQFQADESHVGDQCAICMEEINIGRKMMRLECDGQHTFCKVCIEGWFADHNTCPICRHIF